MKLTAAHSKVALIEYSPRKLREVLKTIKHYMGTSGTFKKSPHYVSPEAYQKLDTAIQQTYGWAPTQEKKMDRLKSVVKELREIRPALGVKGAPLVDLALKEARQLLKNYEQSVPGGTQSVMN